MTEEKRLPRLPDRFYAVPDEPRHRESLELIKLLSELEAPARQKLIAFAANLAGDNRRS